MEFHTVILDQRVHLAAICVQGGLQVRLLGQTDTEAVLYNKAGTQTVSQIWVGMQAGLHYQVAPSSAVGQDQDRWLCSFIGRAS